MQPGAMKFRAALHVVRETIMKRKRILRLCGLFCGAALTVLGILRGEPAVILQKAVKLCLECIGIG